MIFSKSWNTGIDFFALQWIFLYFRPKQLKKLTFRHQTGIIWSEKPLKINFIFQKISKGRPFYYYPTLRSVTPQNFSVHFVQHFLFKDQGDIIRQPGEKNFIQPQKKRNSDYGNQGIFAGKRKKTSPTAFTVRYRCV